jgi:hypothetical protein
MKKDIETRGRPRNDDFVDFCELLEADFPEPLEDAFTVYGSLLGGDKQAYLNFRNSASLTALKKRMKSMGYKMSVYFQDGMVYLKARKV